jgi:hypothetical protein
MSPVFIDANLRDSAMANMFGRYTPMKVTTALEMGGLEAVRSSWMFLVPCFAYPSSFPHNWGYEQAWCYESMI